MKKYLEFCGLKFSSKLLLTIFFVCVFKGCINEQDCYDHDIHVNFTIEGNVDVCFYEISGYNFEKEEFITKENLPYNYEKSIQSRSCMGSLDPIKLSVTNHSSYDTLIFKSDREEYFGEDIEKIILPNQSFYIEFRE